MNQGGGGGEANGEALLAGGQPQAQSNVGFARAARTSGILPGVRDLRFRFATPSTRAAARRSQCLVRNGMLELSTTSFGKPIER
jgi:hypothetical protein